MGQFVAGARIPNLDQIVTVNGVPDARLWCESISHGTGIGTTTADFSVPELLWDSYRNDLRDAKVAVYVFAEGATPPDNPDFIGYLCTDNAEVGPDADRAKFSAKSITSFLSRVFVGQESGVPEKTYALVDPVTRNSTNITPLKILREIFDELPDLLRIYEIGLGLTHALNDTSDLTSHEVKFRLSDVGSAIDTLLALYGDVGVTERFSGPKTYLDFYKIQEHSSARATVRVCRWDDPASTGANVATIQKSDSSAETITRVIGYGSPVLCMVSCKSYVENLSDLSEAVAAKRLIRDWNPKWEPIVLSNPKLATREQGAYTVTVTAGVDASATGLSVKSAVAIPAGSELITKSGERISVTGYTLDAEQGGTTQKTGTVIVTRAYQGSTAGNIAEGAVLEWVMPGIEFVFRRYRLPKCFEGRVKRRENCYKKDDGKAIPVQVWQYRAVTKKDAGGGPDSLQIGAMSKLPSLVSGANLLLEQGVFTLAKPAVEAVAVVTREDGGGQKTTNQETVVGITFTVEAPAWLKHDTGVPISGTLGLPFAAEGLTESWQEQKLVYSQFTSAGYPMKDETGAEQRFGCVFFDPDNDDVLVTHGSTTPVVIQNDTATLKASCEKILIENNRRARTYAITIPYFTRGYSVGQMLTVYGQADYVSDAYKITGADLSMPMGQRASTTLTVDNVKPPYRQKATRR